MSDEGVIAAFARDIGALREPQDLIERLASALAALGFVAFTYGAGKKTEAGGVVADIIWSTLAPDWIAHYAANHYYRDDRLVRAAQLRLAPFTYEEIFATPPQSARQQEMERRFGYVSGVVAPMHGPGVAFGVLSAAAPLGSPVGGIERRRVAAVHYAATLLHDHVLGLKLPKSPIQLVIPSIGLTERERQCLTWVAAGKTNHDIGAILRISARTAKKYVEGAMSKLGASNRAQAAARALALGLIDS